MIKINDRTNRNLNEICKEHYEELKKPVEKAIKKDVTGKKRKDYLLTNLEEIITGKPEDLIKILGNYKRFCSRNKTIKWSTHLSRAFSYENFRTRKKYNLYKLAEKLDVNVCPYCNRQYTFTIIDNKKEITRPEFDHFFNQKKYPLFALSFYNLIPSCHICNATLKHDKPFNLIENIHPYLNGFGSDCKFTYKPMDSSASEGLNLHFEIKLKLSNTSQLLNNIKGNIEVFRTAEIYKKHKDIVKEIVRRKHISGGNYLIRLKQMFTPHLNDINELYLIAFGNYYNESNHENRPLAKFSRDIFDDSLFTL